MQRQRRTQSTLVLLTFNLETPIVCSNTVHQVFQIPLELSHTVLGPNRAFLRTLKTEIPGLHQATAGLPATVAGTEHRAMLDAKLTGTRDAIEAAVRRLE